MVNFTYNTLIYNYWVEQDEKKKRSNYWVRLSIIINIINYKLIYQSIISLQNRVTFFWVEGFKRLFYIGNLYRIPELGCRDV